MNTNIGNNNSIFLGYEAPVVRLVSCGDNNFRMLEQGISGKPREQNNAFSIDKGNVLPEAGAPLDSRRAKKRGKRARGDDTFIPPQVKRRRTIEDSLIEPERPCISLPNLLDKRHNPLLLSLDNNDPDGFLTFANVWSLKFEKLDVTNELIEKNYLTIVELKKGIIQSICAHIKTIKCDSFNLSNTVYSNLITELLAELQAVLGMDAVLLFKKQVLSQEEINHNSYDALADSLIESVYVERSLGPHFFKDQCYAEMRILLDYIKTEGNPEANTPQIIDILERFAFLLSDQDSAKCLSFLINNEKYFFPNPKFWLMQFPCFLSMKLESFDEILTNNLNLLCNELLKTKEALLTLKNSYCNLNRADFFENANL